MEKRVIDLNSDPVLYAKTPYRKQWIILAMLLPLLAAWFYLPTNLNWVKSKVLDPYSNLDYEFHHQDEELRLSNRLGNSYRLSMSVKLFAGADTNRLILVPPTSYFQNRGITYHVPEPAVFYYYTGLKTLWTNSSNVQQATDVVLAENGGLVLKPATSIHLKDSLEAWKEFKPAL